MTRGDDRNLILAAGLSVAAFVSLAFAPALFNDGDTSWHLAAGRLMIERGAVPDTDPFSFTAAGRPWVAHEWLAEVVMAGVYGLASWAALALLFGLAVAATLFLIGRRTSGLPPIAAAAAITGVFSILVPFIVARPHVLAWPMLAGWTILLLRARKEERAPPLAAAAALMLVWANLHGSFALGLALAGFFALEAIVAASGRRRALIGWGAFCLVSLLAALVTPHGAHGLIFPVALSRMETLPLIQEWQATDLRETPGLILGLLLALAALVRAKLWRQPLRLLLLAGLLYLAFAHVRHQAVLAIVGGLVLIDPLDGKPGAGPPGAQPALVALTALALVAASVVRLAIPLQRPDSASNPLTAIAHIPPGLREQPVLNSYSFGGPLILAGIRPFIDGRADMYGDDFLRLHKRLMEGDMAAFRHAAERWELGWTILSPQDPLAGRLQRERGWRRLYADRWAVIDVREPVSGQAR